MVLDEQQSGHSSHPTPGSQRRRRWQGVNRGFHCLRAGRRSTNVEGNGGKQPAGIKASDGKLWFPTAGGLAVVDPRKARRASGLPPVLIEDVLIDQSAVLASGGAVRIEPGQSAIDIAYTAPVYRGADRLRFRYRLEGLDSELDRGRHAPHGKLLAHSVW